MCYTKLPMRDKFSDAASKMSQYVSSLQDTICAGINTFETRDFMRDLWNRPGGGGGDTRVLQDGHVFERGGVNTSTVFGELQSDQEIAMFTELCRKKSAPLSDLKSAHFFATGISLVLHPANPMAPTVHANYRYFELNAKQGSLWWFGGGADLTPCYLFEEDASHFHRTLNEACIALAPDYYPRFKKKCDDYFYLPHRKEHRGIGGIFYDYLNEASQEHYLSLTKRCGAAFLNSYLPILEKRINLNFNENEKNWQRFRRGRYVEFNLLHDRGTQFGLQTNGRIESILISLPRHASWGYQVTPEKGSREEKLVTILEHPRDWI